MESHAFAILGDMFQILSQSEMIPTVRGNDNMSEIVINT